MPPPPRYTYSTPTNSVCSSLSVICPPPKYHFQTRRRGERGQRWPTCFLHRWEFSCKASSPVPSFSHNVNLSGSRINNKEKALEITALVPVTISIESIRQKKEDTNIVAIFDLLEVEEGSRMGEEFDSMSK